MRTYDERTKAAADTWMIELPVEVHAEVRRVLDDGADLAAKRWQSWCNGVEPFVAQEGGSPEAVPRGGGVVGGVRSQDPEHPGSASSASPLHLPSHACR